MASNATSTALPNPNTPYAFLDPTLADQFQVSIYLYIAGLAAYIWDWLMSMSDEYQMMRKSRWSLPNVVYFISRVGTLGYCVSATVFQAAPVAHCQILLYIIGGFFMVAVPSTSFLFLLRLRAVYIESKFIQAFFGALWISIMGLSVLVPLAIDGAHIGPTRRCINTAVRQYGSTPIILNAINDTLIFLAISFRIVANTFLGETWGARARSFVKGDGLPRVSKGLLQGGQLYYFATIGLSIVTAAMVLAPNIPPVYHAMFTIPNIALESAMACRVFRNVKLGFIKDPQLTTMGVSRSTIKFDSGNEISLKHHPRLPTSSGPNGWHVDVEVTKTTDVIDDMEYDTAQRSLSPSRSKGAILPMNSQDKLDHW